MLARALLELDRLDEAAALADPSIGGDDLKATIGLLGVRAEVLARRGGVDEAERLARRAVEIASGTDALLDHADARLALSRVLAAAGRSGEAAAEAARARDLYEAKGSVVGVRRAGMAPTTPAVAAAQDTARAEPRAARRRVVPNLATANFEAWVDAMDARDTDALERLHAPGLHTENHDLRTAIEPDGLGRCRDEFFAADVQPLDRTARRRSARRHAIHRVDADVARDRAAEGPIDYRSICVTRTDAEGRLTQMHRFADDDLGRAMALFVELWAADELDGANRERALATRRSGSLPPHSATTGTRSTVITHTTPSSSTTGPQAGAPSTGARRSWTRARRSRRSSTT